MGYLPYVIILGAVIVIGALVLESAVAKRKKLKIYRLSDSIVNLSNLHTLSIIGTGLTYLPDSIGKLNNLNSLFLNGNKLTSIPESICNLPTNCYISVDNNNICDEQYHYDCIDNWGQQNCGD